MDGSKGSSVVFVVSGNGFGVGFGMVQLVRLVRWFWAIVEIWLQGSGQFHVPVWLRRFAGLLG